MRSKPTAQGAVGKALDARVLALTERTSTPTTSWDPRSAPGAYVIGPGKS